MQLTSDALPADLSSFLHAPAASSSGPLDISPLLAPNAERLGRWYSERLGQGPCWALIVEPHRQIAELMAHLLEFELGIQAVSLPGLRLISTLFRRWSPDLVLAELVPNSGIPSAEDLESLRPLLDAAQARPSLLPVILCTTYLEVTPAMAQSAGFAGLIYKPFLPSTLVATVRQVLGQVPARQTN
ncbi:MAG TPA: response regulator [Ktedonobacterales bacterium]|nr:response regulator [Ktedonobacterales bacterium]